MKNKVPQYVPHNIYDIPWFLDKICTRSKRYVKYYSTPHDKMTKCKNICVTYRLPEISIKPHGIPQYLIPYVGTLFGSPTSGQHVVTVLYSQILLTCKILFDLL